MKALYYPSTHITEERILKNGLLLWDSIQTIVPYNSFEYNLDTNGSLMREAHELIVEPRVPNIQEKTQAQKMILSYLGSDRRLRTSTNLMHARQYLIYPDKLLDTTWSFLVERDLAHWDGQEQDYAVDSFLGLMIMSFLADACASSQLTKITDSIGAYSWLEESKAQILGGLYTQGLDVSQVGPAYDRLITISLNVLDAQNLSLESLIQFRKRELRSSSTDYSEFRLRYSKSLKIFIDRISTEAKSKNDIKEIENQFRLEIKDDINDLKKELRFETLKTIFSKEVAISVIAFAGALIEPISGLTTLATTIKTIGVAPLIKAGIEYKQARRKILRSHPNSLLYLIKRYNQYGF